jgi:hypothetical protein
MVFEAESLVDQTIQNWKLSDNFLWWRDPLDPKTKIETVRKWVKEQKPLVVFIDNLQRFLQLKKIEDYAEMSTALQPLEDIARIEGCHLS